MAIAPWSGRNIEVARAYMKDKMPTNCAHCNKPVDGKEPWVVGHIKPRATHPELTWDTSNWRLEHRTCSNRTGQSVVIAKAKQDALKEAGVRPVLSHATEGGQRPQLPFSLPVTQAGPMTPRNGLAWDPEYMRKFDWLKALADVPDDASPPLLMSPVSDEAIDSYGWQAVEWIEATQGLTLRWWQRLSIVRQLEYRQDGTLCYRKKIESAPRRAGKSVGIRGMALWRMAHADLFGEVQTIIHTGSDLAICREIQRGAWRWAEAEAWTVTRANGKEAIESRTGDRWLTRAQDAVYGYDCCLGLMDEAWNVKPDTLSEGLEPATLERNSPQIILTSTAHRRATSLMRTELIHAITSEDTDVLLLLWAAAPGANPADPEVWRAASPHWTEDRRNLMASKYEKALAGEEDPEFDDLDPMKGFEAQYLNIWRVHEPRTVGEGIVSGHDWGILKVDTPTGPPDAIAVESWFSEGVSVVSAWRGSNGLFTVSMTHHANIASAAGSVASTMPKRPVLVGSSLADDPVWMENRVRVAKRTGTTRAAVGELMRLLADDSVRHDGSELLTSQVMGLRVSPGADGPRIRSTGRADAIKATLWAITDASLVKQKMVLPSRYRTRL